MLDKEEIAQLNDKIVEIAKTNGYVTPKLVQDTLKIDGRLASKLVHDLEIKGNLLEKWVRVYVPFDKKDRPEGRRVPIE